MRARQDILVGCCGFSLPRARYFRTFRLLEIQQSFYEPPSLKTAQRWRSFAPEGFIFTLKAWQLITHESTSPTYRRLRTSLEPAERSCYGSFKPTPQVLTAWERTRQIARALDAPLVVFQCPASFKPVPQNLTNMRSFFRAIQRDNLAMAWEPRGGMAPGGCEILVPRDGFDPLRRSFCGACGLGKHELLPPPRHHGVRLQLHPGGPKKAAFLVFWKAKLGAFQQLHHGPRRIQVPDAVGAGLRNSRAGQDSGTIQCQGLPKCWYRSKINRSGRCENGKR